jgi:hypothetical protein
LSSTIIHAFVGGGVYFIVSILLLFVL